jgi:hypothetical protein
MPSKHSERAVGHLDRAQEFIRIGKFKDAASALKSAAPSLPPTLAVLHAVLEAETAMFLGNRERALALATTLINRRELEDDLIRSKCDYIIGQTHLQFDQPHLAVQHLQASVRLASALGERHLVCVAQISLLRLLARMREPTAVPTLLSEVRSNVLGTQDRDLLCLLHLACGRIEGMAGNIEQAARHYAAATEFLRGSENPYLKGCLAIDSCALVDCIS